MQRLSSHPSLAGWFVGHLGGLSDQLARRLQQQVKVIGHQAIRVNLNCIPLTRLAHAFQMPDPGAEAGRVVVDGPVDAVSGVAQGGVSAVTDLIARVRGRERPRTSPRGGSIARSTAKGVGSHPVGDRVGHAEERQLDADVVT